MVFPERFLPLRSNGSSKKILTRKRSLITSPNYYGICSDVRAIADIAHRYGKVLIVDEAHGAHLHFSDELPPSAIQSGADLVINSTHKTLASFTQSAALHYNTELVDQYLLEDKLQCIQSTSPSYLLMTSMDICADILEKHRQELMGEWIGNLTAFYDRIAGIPGVRTMGKMKGLDWTKINLSLGELGITGAMLDKILLDDYDIYIELFTGDWIMALTGIGNTKEDYGPVRGCAGRHQPEGTGNRPGNPQDGA